MITPLSMTRHPLAGLAVATLLMTCMSSCVLSAGFGPAMSPVHANNAASHLGQAPRTCEAESLSCSGAMLRLRGGDGDDEDLFADDEEGDVAAAAELKAKAAAAKDKAKADKPPAKTNIVLDVKGWGEETDMAELEKSVRSIVMEGLLWGASGLEDVGYGIKKLRITCVVEDEKVSVDLLEENITNFEELVQSVDVAAMNKI